MKQLNLREKKMSLSLFKSTLSFPFTRMWLGIQHLTVSFEWDMELKMVCEYC